MKDGPVEQVVALEAAQWSVAVGIEMGPSRTAAMGAASRTSHLLLEIATKGLLFVYLLSFYPAAQSEAVNFRDYSGRIGHRCPPYQFDCDPNRPLPLCVPLIALRNCRVDCPNMSDEWCGFGKVLCDTKLSGLPCGRCVRFEEMETRCRDHRWKALCNVSGSIKCSSTANCVLPQWLLDGKDDCGDGSDEEPCRLIECSTTTIASATSTTAATSVPPENSTPVGVSSAPGIRICETGEFRCLSGECVEEGRVLDGVKDCWDSSDESKLILMNDY
ncbi:hypothetical protein RB195_010740 [Necator americanus]|uniref:Low-density lipoprotein receptor domain class A n=1 Tax=Necator americanus TaxID=51031 RepID=A0ABR1D2J0_NECAM